MKRLLIVAGTAALLLLGSTVAFALYYKKTVNTPYKPGAEPVRITVEQGESAEAIAEELKAKGVIRETFVFRVYLKLSGKAAHLQSGEYLLSGAMTTAEIVDALASGRVAARKITLIEGWTVSQIAAYLESSAGVSKQDVLAAAKKDYRQSFDFLGSAPAGALEGYLFPDTYTITYSAGAEDIIRIVLANFGGRLSADLRAEITRQKKTVHEVITLASIVELEVPKESDRPIVAGIFLKRLSLGMRLESDATVNYVVDKPKRQISLADKEIDSPYNTYRYAGLPPGPIGNPGLSAIRAAIYPAQTEHLYFCSAKDGTTHYAKTFAEHNQNVSKYCS